MNARNQRLRDSLFALPDARGNIPNITYESSEAESRRLNAGRYETVGQMEQALDRRSASLQHAPPYHGGRGVGQSPPSTSSTPQGGSLIGSLLLIALGAGLAYAFLSGDGDGSEGAKDVTPLPPSPNPTPAPTPTSTTVVHNNPAPVVPVVVAPPPIVIEPAKPRRTRRAAVAPVTVVATPVTTETKTT